jgi:hypothetical protein
MLWHDERMVTLAGIAVRLIEDALRWVVLLFRSTEAVRAENLFLRRQLALYIERGVRPRRADAPTRVSLAVLAKLFDWRGALVIVQPATVIRWHRAGWRLFWRLKSRRGRPPIPEELRRLIRRMASGRVEDWRADLRLRWVFRGFRRGPQSGCHRHVSSPRHIERSVRFSSHYAHLFASCHGLWDLYS